MAIHGDIVMWGRIRFSQMAKRAPRVTPTHALVLTRVSYMATLLITSILIINFYVEVSSTWYISSQSHQNPTGRKWLEDHFNITDFLANPRWHETPVCSSDAEVLIAIITSPTGRHERNRIRQTWAKKFPKSWRTLFFIGKSNDRNIESMLETENRIWGDLVRLDILDTYLNLTIKVSLTLKWASQHCSSTAFTLKVDDDVFVNSRNLVTFIQCTASAMRDSDNYVTTTRSSSQNPPCSFWHPDTMLGYYIDATTNDYKSYIAAGYLYKGKEPVRNPASKWYVSEIQYPNNFYPDFLSGTAYLLSTSLIQPILQHAIQTPLVPGEDIFITGLVMRRSLNLKLSNVRGWNNFRPRFDDPCYYNEQVTSHGFGPAEMRDVAEAVEALEPEECGGSIRQFLVEANTFISNYFPYIKKSDYSA